MNICYHKRVFHGIGHAIILIAFDIHRSPHLKHSHHFITEVVDDLDRYAT
jgi:hypothetical protein